MRSWIKDILLTLLLGSIFLWAGREFYKDLNSQISNEGGEIIGETTFIENGAQRKFAGRALWGEMETSSPIYNYDSLRTINDSQVTIKLLDGTEITLDANSYIVLEWGEEARNIEFLGGNISAASNGSDSKLQIKSEDTVIALNKANVTLNKEEGQGINLSVDAGSIGITVDGETTDVAENFRASISDGVRVEQDAVKLKYPSNNRLIVTTSAAIPMNFSWEQILPLNKARLEIAEYKDFTHFSEYELESGDTSFTINTLPGTYYWRISGSFPDGTAYASPANRMVIIRDNAPILQVPGMDERFEYRNSPPELAFSWEASSLANESHLQVAQDEEFTDMVVEIQGQNNFQTIRELSEGTYYWRILPEYTSADIVAYSSPAVRRFQINRIDTLAPPRLILPENDEKVNPLKTKSGLRFSWKPDREIGSYRILISSDAEMNTPLIDTWLNRNSYLMADLPPAGNYYWQVEGLDRENKAVPPSEVRSFTVMDSILSVTPLKPVDNGLSIVDSFDNFRFSWDSTMDGPFKVEVFRNTLGAQPLITQISESDTLNLVLPGEGDYIWQISAIDDEENILLLSNQASFKVVQRLQPPGIILPGEGSVQSLLGSNALMIRWQPVPGASAYSATLIPRNSAYPSIIHESSPETFWSISDKKDLRPGEYTLQVQAHNLMEGGIINSSLSATRSFFLDRVVDYGAPILTYPARNQQISQLTLVDQKPSFRWTQSPLLAKQKIRLSRDPDFQTLILDEELTTQSRTVPELEPGTYYVQIQGEDNLGNRSPDSAIYPFIVNSVPDLPGMQMFSPQTGQVLDMESQNQLDFSWVAVPRVSYYRIALYEEDSLKALFKEDKWETTKYTFNKLEDLDVGRFRFEIQAVRERNNQIFQESPVLSVPFELTLPEITEIPDILSPERQYAH
ncbi:hypothetical protein EXM22_11560 [Oceanispirochaeta crateris]|uniref:Fibronectin type-III domain-containing protein n=1 Tax=Oceanispirochaeta crateris TaxID=2518645 RepID=A0A5C1QNN9_9SPIO|nr:FecR family protein [Oceanispirochaeta crateris]QEN08590.1 hypothetical protein EXM22_11560 [Oceanispirochaeta crateris]